MNPNAKTKASNREQPPRRRITTLPALHPSPKLRVRRLDGGLVGDRRQGLGAGLLGEGDAPCLAGKSSLTLDLDGGALGLSLGLGRGVLLHPAQEAVSGSRRADVLDAEVDTLLDVSVLDLLVDDDADGGLGNVVDDTGLSVVNLVGHTVVRKLVRIFGSSLRA